MSRWDYKGEYGLAASYREMWGRIMEWANGEHQATLPDLDYVAETCRETDAELTRLRSLAARAEDVEGMVNAILSVSFDREGESWADTVARRVRAYLKEGR